MAALVEDEDARVCREISDATCHERVRRAPVWVAGSVVQGVSAGAMVWVDVVLEGTAAGLALLGLLIVFSLARGLCSVAHKDVGGKTVPKTQRRRLTGYTATVSGVLMALRLPEVQQAV